MAKPATFKSLERWQSNEGLAGKYLLGPTEKCARGPAPGGK
jgi:hypothetical protein